jgi:protein-disulfide isomerase
VLERADRARITGNANAPVWMVIVSDFQCPYCKTWHDSTLPAIRREYVATGKIRMAYINLPLPMHPHAWPAAETAMCAGLQGRFWEMGDKLFETQPGWEQLPKVEPYFDSLATSVGVQLPALHSCLAAHTTRPLIQSDYDRSVAAGVNSTPTFLIGNSMVRGAQPIQNFRAVLDSVIAAAGRSTTR